MQETGELLVQARAKAREEGQLGIAAQIDGLIAQYFDGIVPGIAADPPPATDQYGKPIQDR